MILCWIRIRKTKHSRPSRENEVIFDNKINDQHIFSENPHTEYLRPCRRADYARPNRKPSVHYTTPIEEGMFQTAATGDEVLGSRDTETSVTGKDILGLCITKNSATGE